jgi:hypothetical protein
MHDSQLSRRGLLSGLASLALAPKLFAAGVAKKWDASMELAIDVTIATIEGRRVRRPYVAVWLEDSAGKPVRTLSLWVQKERPGPRWHPDLRRWWRNEDGRDKLVETVSSATRGPGKYSLAWDGKNDAGKYVDQGKYTLVIEAAREHGTYAVMKKEIEVGKKPFKNSIEGNVEIEGATVEYRKRR